MEPMANQRVSESGNVAIELVVAIALTVTFLVPSAETVSQIYKSKIELTQSFSVLSRTFQKSPYESIKSNMESVRIMLQRQSTRNLRVFLQYKSNSDGMIQSVTIKNSINTDAIGISQLNEEQIAIRSPYAS